jgi:carbon monoxide dehydrogenase subunit G
MIHIEQKFDVRAPQAEVWAFVSDMSRVTACVPGVEKVEPLGDNEYHLRMSTKIGPIKATFDGQVTFVERRPPEFMQVQMDGKDAITKSKIRVAATVDVSQAGDGLVTITGKADVDVLGALGKYGQGVADKKAAEIGAEFTKNLRAQLEH